MDGAMNYLKNIVLAEGARAQLERLVSSSDVKEPVITFFVVHDGPTDAGFGRMYAEGMSEKALEQIARQAIGRYAPLEGLLMADVVEKGELDPTHTQEIDGLRFAIAGIQSLHNALVTIHLADKGYVLLAEDGRQLLPRPRVD